MWGWRDAMIGTMGPVAGVGAVAGDAAGPGAGGVVSRPRLFGRLGAARVIEVSAAAGSGKTVLLRSWVSGAGLAGSAAEVPDRSGVGADPGADGCTGSGWVGDHRAAAGGPGASG